MGIETLSGEAGLSNGFAVWKEFYPTKEKIGSKGC